MEIKNRIKHKADDLYRRYGVKSITMDEIASQLGVSKKTIYQCFSDKNELVGAVMDDMLGYNKVCCQDSRIHAKDAVHEIFLAKESLYKVMLNMNPTILFDLERGHPSVFKKFLNFKYTYLFDILKKNIERGKKEGLYRQELDADLIAKLRIECITLPFNEELFPKSQFPFATIQQAFIEFYLYGMVNPNGYKLILKYQKESEKKDKKRNNEN